MGCSASRGCRSSLQGKQRRLRHSAYFCGFDGGFRAEAAKGEIVDPQQRCDLGFLESAAIPTDLDENRIRAVALETDLVDVKVCAVTDIWSGLKLVVRAH